MKKLNIIYAALIFVFLLSMCSCGARKSTVDKSKEETKTEIKDNSVNEIKTDTNVKTTTTVKTDDKNETVTEETILEPADNTKESFVIEKDGTKVVLNNVKKTVKKTTQKNNTKSESAIVKVENLLEVLKQNKEVKQTKTTKKEIKTKQVDKKQFSTFVMMCVVAFGLILLWCVYRFYKKLPLVPKL